MRSLKLPIALAIATVMSASAVRAQTCLGFPSYSGGGIHLNAGGQVADSANSYALAVGGGTAQGLFANLGIGQVSYEGIDEKSTLGFLEFGFQIPIAGAQLCPIAGGGYSVGPDDDALGVKVTSRVASAGIALGVPFGVRAFRVIPNGAVKYEYLSTKIDEDVLGTTTDTQNSGLVDLGLGLVFADRVSVQPTVHIPFGGDDTEPFFGLFASISFGRKR